MFWYLRINIIIDNLCIVYLYLWEKNAMENPFESVAIHFRIQNIGQLFLSPHDFIISNYRFFLQSLTVLGKAAETSQFWFRPRIHML